MKPEVSIVVPYYNGSKTISRAVGSALAQNGVEVEVIIVDDGSNEPVPSELFGDARTSLIRKSNGGVASARNAGLAVARGNYVQFLDQDDVLYPEKCAVQIQAARENPGRLTICDAHLINEKTGRSATWSSGFYETKDPVIHVAMVTMQTSAALHERATLLHLGGFRVDAPPCEDRELHMRYALNGVPFFHVGKTLYKIHRISGSQSDRSTLLCISKEEELVRELCASLEKAGSWSEGRKEAVSGWAARIGRRWLRAGLRKRAKAAFEFACVIDRSGGLRMAYAPKTRLLRRIVGAELCESIATRVNQIFGRTGIA